MKTAVIRPLWLATLGLAIAADVLAQPPPDVGSSASSSQVRIDDADASRREKSQQLQPNTPGRVESILRHMEDSRLVTRVFDPPNGPFALLAVAEGGGFGGGGGYRFGTERQNLTLTGAMSLTQYWIAEARFRAIQLADGRVSTELVLRRSSQPREDFFGLGPESSELDRTTYALDTVSVGGSAKVELKPWLAISGGLSYLQPDIGTGEDPRFASTDQRFTDDQAPGLTVQPEFLQSTAALEVDTRDPRGNARAGGRYQLTYTHHRDQDTGHYSFGRTTVELQQFVPFWNESRVIALRVYADRTDPGADSEVPFYYQPWLGNSTTLRAYKTQRFRDRSSLLLQAEYRYEINPFLMAALFGDAGQVASDWGQFRLGEFQGDVGFGLRFGHENGVALRTDVAFGDEGPRFHIRFGGVF
jgi:Omp85 superfamily domain